LTEFQTSLRVRGYEVGAHRVVPLSVLAQYTEHARWQAFYERSLAVDLMFTGGRRMVVRSQRFDLLRPVPPLADLRVTLWVERVGRTSLDFGQEILLTGLPDLPGATGLPSAAATALEAGPQVAVRALVRAVSVGTDGRPLPLPEPIRDLEAPRGLAPLPRLTPASPLTADTGGLARVAHFRARPSDVDVFQHVNHGRVVAFYDDARLALAPDTRPLSVTISYDAELFAGDELQVALWPAGEVPGVTPEGHAVWDSAILCPARGGLRGAARWVFDA